MKRTALLAASLALVAGTTIGCGGDDGGGGGAAASDEPPTNASTAEFCGGFKDLITELSSLGADAKPAEAVATLKKSGDALGEVGTPEAMPDDARAGFVLVLDEIEKLDDDATREDINGLGADISKDQQTDMDAYEKYLQETCAKELGGAGGTG